MEDLIQSHANYMHILPTRAAAEGISIYAFPCTQPCDMLALGIRCKRAGKAGQI